MSKTKARPSVEKIPYGKVANADDIGACIRHARKQAGATLVDAAGLSGVGTRFFLEIEHGKETAELGKVLQVLHRLGLEVTIRPRGERPRGALKDPS